MIFSLNSLDITMLSGDSTEGKGIRDLVPSSSVTTAPAKPVLPAAALEGDEHEDIDMQDFAPRDRLFSRDYVPAGTDIKVGRPDIHVRNPRLVVPKVAATQTPPRIFQSNLDTDLFNYLLHIALRHYVVLNYVSYMRRKMLVKSAVGATFPECYAAALYEALQIAWIFDNALDSLLTSTTIEIVTVDSGTIPVEIANTRIGGHRVYVNETDAKVVVDTAIRILCHLFGFDSAKVSQSGATNAKKKQFLLQWESFADTYLTPAEALRWTIEGIPFSFFVPYFRSWSEAFHGVLLRGLTNKQSVKEDNGIRISLGTGHTVSYTPKYDLVIMVGLKKWSEFFVRLNGLLAEVTEAEDLLPA